MTKQSSLSLSPRGHGLRGWLSSWQLYVLLVPTFVYIAIFAYAPMYGVLMAFKDYSIGGTISGADWVGFKHFRRLFNMPNFWPIVRNTLSISVYSLLAGFPVPIIFATLVNSLTSTKYKKVVQTVTYAPHFISTVVLVGMMNVLLAPNNGATGGVINGIIMKLGGESIFFMGEPDVFPSLYVWSGIWQSMGFSSIVYLAALTGVSPELHEAAIMDGASKLKRVWHIDLPCIAPTMIILLIMSCGNIMTVGQDKILLMQTPLNLGVSEVISTYVYKIGIQGNQFSFATAFSLFNSLVNIILLVVVNAIASKVNQVSLW
jgi:putative aldouronate transport system permease protein